MIDWQFLFLAWELKGKYPAILDQPVARELFDDANTLLDEIIADGSLHGPRRVRLLAGARRGRRHRAGRPDGVRFPMLRQQTAKPAGRANRCLADYVAPAGDHLGGFAVAIHGAEELAADYEAEHDDYRAIMVKALADRLAEAFAEYIHLRGPPGLVRAGRRARRWRTCTPSGSAASGRRSATRPAPTTARSASCSTCSTPSRSASA